MKFNKVTYHFDDWGVIFSLHEKSWTAQINHPGLCVGIFLAEYFSVVSAEVAPDQQAQVIDPVPEPSLTPTPEPTPTPTEATIDQTPTNP